MVIEPNPTSAPSFVARVIVAPEDHSDSSRVGTGIVVAPGWVVTCRHVVWRREWDGQRYEYSSELAARSVDRGPGTTGVEVTAEGFPHPNSRVDLVLLELPESGNASSWTPAVFLGAEPSLLVGLEVDLRVVGFSGALDAPAEVADGLRPKPGQVRAGGKVKGFQVELGLPEGMSGGPAWIELDGEELCVGIAYLGSERAGHSTLYGVGQIFELLDRAVEAGHLPSEVRSAVRTKSASELQARRRGRGVEPYLRRVAHDCARLPLANLLKSKSDEAGPGLPALFTPLDVDGRNPERSTRESEGTKAAELTEDQPALERYPALGAVAAHDRVVITGDPGSGKSSLARFLSGCLAAQLLGERPSLSELVEGVTLRDGEDASGAQRRATEQFGDARIPVFVELRRFASDESENRGFFPRLGQVAHADHLWEYLRADWGSLAKDTSARLEERVRANDGLGAHFVLDGIDEVAEAEHRRVRLKQVVESLIAELPRARVLVTARTYAYQSGHE